MKYDFPRRRIVVDACVLHSAGESDYPASDGSRRALEAMRKVCHRAVVTSAIYAEWERHMSKWSSRWLVAMQNLREKLPALGDPAIDAIDQAVQKATWTRDEARIAKKDLHLLVAALAADRIVISNETSCAHAFAKLIDSVDGLGQLQWVVPAEDPAGVEAWLQRGARPLKRFRLDRFLA
jgi:hypothetical protein